MGRPKFAPRALREEIKQVVGDQPLAEAKTWMIISESQSG
jgi:hypothetical protein